ncbi:MAG: CRISPR system precrRNA processing endoribonuclease RAMP protein Cas6 [Thermodesulfobacteriota bacterium]|nr:CRISPR system precrRNA processing endoribonuclease RAMP protein Cas6 [Thermodesulfobacteriota bacterium]
MLYGKYDFTCCFEEDAVLPAYKGSTLRGVFGGALKQVTCALKQQTCEDCLLNQKCLYPLIFKTDIIDFQDRRKVKGPPPPPPMVIEPPETPQTAFSKGDRLTFSLLLFGEVNARLPYFVYAFEQTGRMGIGKKINGKRAGFSLESVAAGGRVIYSPSTGRLDTTDTVTDLPCAAPAEEAENDECRELTLRLETPLRVKHKNRLAAALSFDVFMRACLRRVSDMCNCYGEGEPPWDYPALVQASADVTAKENGLEWMDWERYSGHQNERMKFGGLTGTIVFEGDLARFLPVIRFAEKLHVGKQTVFGLGKFTAAIPAG